MSVNSQHVEEFQPRQAPKASSFYKAAPVPSVPDVSLVFDSNVKSPGQDRLGSDRNDSAPSSYQDKNKFDENEPRTNKPIPVAPLPNESYAAWRARALKSHYEENKCFTNTQFRSEHQRQRDSVMSAACSPNPHEINEPPKFAVHQRIHPTVSHGRLHLSSRVPNSRSALEQSNSNVRSLDRRGGSSESDRRTVTPDQQDHHHTTSKSVFFKPVVLNESRINRRKNVTKSAIQTDSEEESNEANGPRNSYVKHRVHRNPEDEIFQMHGEDFQASLVRCESPKQEKAEKRDSFRDIYRIVKLQNEQISSLQSQVERLLKKNITEAQKSESPKPARKSVEKGTQTEAFEESKVSVGVMTSFTDLKEYSNNRNQNSEDQVTHSQKCENFHVVLSGNNKNECLSSDGKNDIVSQGLTQNSSADIAPANRQCDSLKLVQNMQKIIEENESDEGSSSHTSASGKSSRPVHSKNRVDKRHKSKRNTLTDPIINQAEVKKSEQQSPKNFHEDKTFDTPKAVVNMMNRQKGSANVRHVHRHNDSCRDKYHPGNYSTPKTRHNNEEEVTMTLNGVELQTVADPHISPEPSIHVDIQDYNEFSDEEDNSSTDEGGYSSGNESLGSNEEGEEGDIPCRSQNESESNGKFLRKQDQQNCDPQGSWTFYDNVLGQVNKLLKNQNGEVTQNKTPEMRQNAEKVPDQFPNGLAPKANSSPTLDAVREATLQHLRKLGVDIPYDDKYNVPSSSLPVHNAAQMMQTRRNGGMDHYGFGGITQRDRPPSETSLRMNALAMRYLNEEQLAGCEHLGLKRDHFQPEPVQFTEQQLPRFGGGVIGEVSSADFTMYGMNGTNLSFTTLRYLQRYHLTPGNGTNPQGIWRHQGQYGNFAEASSPKGMNFAKSSPEVGEGFTPMVGKDPVMNQHLQGGDHNLIRQTQAGREAISRQGLPGKGSVRRDVQFTGDRIEQVGSYRNRDMDFAATGKKSRKTIRKHPVDKVKHLDRHGRSASPKGHQNPNAHRREENVPRECDIPRESTHRTQSSNILDITALRQQRKLL